MKEASEETWMPLHLADLDDSAAERIADLAVRRWSSYERRVGGKRKPTRIEDLAKALRTTLRTDSPYDEPSYAEDYLRLARRIAAVLDG